VSILKRAAYNWFGTTPRTQRDPGIFWEQGGRVSDTGIVVSHESAMTFSAVYAAVSLISNSIASLPADVYSRYPNNTRYAVTNKPSWLARPNIELNWLDWCQQTMTSLLLGGNSYSGCVYDRSGKLAELWPLDPRIVFPQRNSVTSDIEYVVNGRALPARDVLHIRGITLPGYLAGMSPVEAARQTIGLGLGAEKHQSKQLANAATPAVIISTAGRLDDDVAKKIGDRFDRLHAGLDNTAKTAVLGNDAKINTLTMTNEQLQFIDSRRFQISDIARWFLIPGFMLDPTVTSTWGTGIEQQGIMFVQHTLTPWIVRIEKALSPFVPTTATGIDTYLKLNTSALMRGDMAARAEYISRKIEHGAARPQDWNALDDENPLPGGDKLWMSQNLQVLDADGLPVVPEPVPAPAPDAPPPPVTTNSVTFPENFIRIVDREDVTHQHIEPRKVTRDVEFIYDDEDRVIGKRETETAESDD
jgi:HK97 family phage portal protein